MNLKESIYFRIFDHKLGASVYKVINKPRPVSLMLTYYPKTHWNDMQKRHFIKPSITEESLTRNEKATLHDVHIIKWYNLSTLNSNELQRGCELTNNMSNSTFCCSIKKLSIVKHSSLRSVVKMWFRKTFNILMTVKKCLAF